MKTKSTVRRISRVFLLFFLFISPVFLFAGSGSITPAPANGAGIRGLMNFTVNFRFVPTAADVAAMEAAIQVANDAICDATDGQIVFGTVTITSGSVNESEADIWVLPDPGRSSVSFWTDGSGFGRDGAHINLFSNGIDGRVIAHELGHLAFGIGDEYDEQCRWGGPCGIGPCFDPGTTDDRNNTIMANQNTMSELSVPANHDPIQGDGSGCPGVETCPGTGICMGSCDGYNGGTGRYEASQNTLINGGLSDWEVLQRNYMGLGLTIPALPVAAVPANCGAFLNIDTQVEGSSLVVLVFDRSGSMSIQDVGDQTRLEFAKAAGRAYVDLQRTKDIDLGIVEFSSTASTVRAVEDLTTVNSTSFKNDIDGLTAGGNTAIGDGLIEARVQLQIAQAVAAAQGETLTNPTVYLLSDGQNNTGADPDAVAANLISAGVTIHSIPVGNGADVDLLSDLASESGGVMLPAYSDDMIPAIYAELAALHQGYTLINGEVGFEEHVFFEFPTPSMYVKLPVERGADMLTVFIGLKDVGTRNLEIENIIRSVDVVGPNGNRVPDARISVIEDAFYRILQIKGPQAGEYTLYVNNTQLISPEVNVVSFVENPGPDFYVDALPRVQSTPDPVLISGAVSFQTSLYDPNISYEAVVIRPDSSIVPITMELDPFTGAISSLFNNFNGGGTYKVVVEARVPEGATALPGESIFDAPSEFEPKVDRFVRVASTSFTLFRPGECPPCAEDNKDCDGDGIPNEVEDRWPDQDIDGDGLPNRCDEDSDGDDIPDAKEKDLDLDQDNIPDVYDRPDGFGCATDSEFKIVKVDVANPDCKQRNGKISVEVDGAKGAVRYRWSHDPALRGPVAENLPAFIYAVTITDESGCRLYATVNLTEDCSRIEETDDIPVSTGCPQRVAQGCEFPVVVTVDVSHIPDTLIGSFTGIMTWDPSVVAYVGPADLLSGFTGFINLDALNGKLIFNGANYSGVGGIVDIFKARFRAIGPVGSTAEVKVDFVSFAAAETFEDLTPILVIDQCAFEIIPSGILGDVNGDGLVTSTDGNIILSADVGLPLPPAIQQRVDNGFGDVNQDGLTNATDALIVLTYDVQLPVPYPVGEGFCPSTTSHTARSLDLRNDPTIDIIYESRAAVDHPERVEVPVYADFSKREEQLGSYKAVVSWDPAKLDLVQHFGGNSAGMESPLVNEAGLTEGKLTIAHAHPAGIGGLVNLFNLQFEELTEGGLGTLDIEFENMSAAQTFRTFRGVTSTEPLPALAPAVNVFPNPFSDQVNIVYELPADQEVRIDVYNAFGQRVATLQDGPQVKGTHRLTWDGPANRNVNAGLYLITVQAGSTVTTKRVFYAR